MKKFITPDFTQSNLNVSATLAEFLHCPNQNATLPVLQQRLARGYKNVVFICFDGMGCHPLAINAPMDGFLRKNTVMQLKSTFPSTTTNATTSLFTNKLPLEHGWFGWSLHFEELQRNVDIYMLCDSQTGEKVTDKLPLSDDSDGYFYHANSVYTAHTVLPKYVSVRQGFDNRITQNTADLFAHVKDICLLDGNHFVYAYCPDPDYTMHEHGVTSDKTKQVIADISARLEQLQKDTTDTLFVVTADHGQIDVAGTVDFYKDTQMVDMLLCPPYLDSRTPCFRVKLQYKRQFEQLFTLRYGKDFVLYPTQQLIDQGYFGDRGSCGCRLGDYVAIGTYTHKLFVGSLPKDDFAFKGHHTSLTEEMLVPLILFES